LKDLKLKVMARMISEPDAALQDLSFEERLGIMVEKEWLAKKNARLQRLLHRASLGLNACIEDIDYTVDRTIDKKTIQALSTCFFIEQKLNIVISGKTGSGKSYIACALGNCACRHGYTVKYFRIPELLLEIQAAKSENRYARFMNQLQNIKLLILDDIGLKAYTLEESRDILEITESRYNKSSTVLSGQVPHTQWYDLFPDPTIADAIMDRFIHNSYILALDSKKSMRAVMAEKTIKDMKITIDIGTYSERKRSPIPTETDH
ncbi:IS21-like element helper ATPase IstB, partial [Pelotomaculum isophthalicicum JI]